MEAACSLFPASNGCWPGAASPRCCRLIRAGDTPCPYCRPTAWSSAKSDKTIRRRCWRCSPPMMSAASGRRCRPRLSARGARLVLDFAFARLGVPRLEARGCAREPGGTVHSVSSALRRRGVLRRFPVAREVPRPGALVDPRQRLARCRSWRLALTCYSEIGPAEA